MTDGSSFRMRESLQIRLPGMCQSVVFPCEGQRAKGWMQIPTDFAHQTLGGAEQSGFHDVTSWC